MTDPAEAPDVCIVGAGAAGGIMAFELARHGVSVGVLESGPRHDFARRPERVRRLLRGEDPWATAVPGLDAYTAGDGAPDPLARNRVRGVGGSSLHWEGYALRMHADDFRMRALHGVADDWPLRLRRVEPYYAKAEAALGIAGSDDDPWASPRSCAVSAARLPVQLYRRAVRARVPDRGSAHPPSLPGPQLDSLRRAGAVSRLRHVPGLPHRGQGQRGPHAHSPGGGDRPRPCAGRCHRLAARARRRAAASTTWSMPARTDASTGWPRACSSWPREPWRVPRLLLLSATRDQPRGIGNGSGFSGGTSCPIR